MASIRPVDDTAWNAFRTWLRLHGFPRSTKLTLAVFPNTGRGLMATADIPKDQGTYVYPRTNMHLQ